LKRLFFFIWVLVLFTPLFSAQMYVVAELFSETWCGYCPIARAALRAMADDSDRYPYFIPLLFQEGSQAYPSPNPSPAYNQRRTLYGVSGLPYARWYGTIEMSGVNTTPGVALSEYISTYNNRVNIESPISVDISFTIDGNNLSATVTVIQEEPISLNNTHVIIALTHNFYSTQSPDYTSSVVRYFQQAFNPNTDIYTQEMTIDPSWELNNLYLVAFVQNLSGVGINRQIHNGMRKALVTHPQPTNVVSYSGPNVISLRWDQKMMDIEPESWKVYKDGMLQTATPLYQRRYTDHNATPGETHTYNVITVFEDGVESVESLFVQGTLMAGNNLHQFGFGNTANGGTSPGPLNIYERSLHGQQMYTAQELNLAGIVGPTAITSLGFYVTNRPQSTLLQFQLRIKHTIASDMTADVPGPWETTQVIPSYQPLAGDWRMIELDEPFQWDGIRNIVIDTAFNRVTSAGQTGMVRIVDVDAKYGYRYTRSNDANQAEVATASALSYKPQMRMTVHIEQSEHDAVVPPRYTKLGSNFPNPFNPSTTIYFDIHSPSEVLLEIYNIKGQLVTTLAEKEYEAGRHFVVWNGVDSLGQRVGSGIYLYKLQTEGYSETKKMIMVK